MSELPHYGHNPEHCKTCIAKEAELAQCQKNREQNHERWAEWSERCKQKEAELAIAMEALKLIRDAGSQERPKFMTVNAQVADGAIRRIAAETEKKPECSYCKGPCFSGHPDDPNKRHMMPLKKPAGEGKP